MLLIHKYLWNEASPTDHLYTELLSENYVIPVQLCLYRLNLMLQKVQFLWLFSKMLLYYSKATIVFPSWSLTYYSFIVY